MFYWLYEFFHQPDNWLRFLRLFRSQTFRAMCAAATGFLIVYFVMPWFIRLMRRRGVSEQARHYSELDAGRKSDVPTMGGVILISAIVISALLWCDPTNGFVSLALGAGILGSLLGGIDDIRKLKNKSSDHGLSRKPKYIVQALIGVALAAAMMSEKLSPIPAAEIRGSFYMPFVKYGVNAGLWNFAIITFFIMVTTNAVNLTDGMDGLASVPSAMVFLVLAFFAYVIGHSGHALYLQFFPYANELGIIENHAIAGAGELAVLCCAGAGACAGFLWYNAFPATIMMGDTGSLGLGALLGASAVVIRQEAIFIIAGGIFCVELLSSFVQDYIGLKLLGRRILFRAPFHSSMLHCGLSENKVTVRFWLISAALAVAALATIKLR